jgi:hypothetical protein
MAVLVRDQEAAVRGSCDVGGEAELRGGRRLAVAVADCLVALGAAPG